MCQAAKSINDIRVGECELFLDYSQACVPIFELDKEVWSMQSGFIRRVMPQSGFKTSSISRD